MGAIAVFDYPTWIARYPEFAGVAQPLATDYFNEATLYLANDGSGPVCDAGQQLTLLNMLTAHVAKVNATVAGPNGTVQPASPLVGRISTASEGSVSVSTDLSGASNSALYAYLSQSQYGLSFWAATAVYRTMRYVPGRRRNAYAGLYGSYGSRGW